MKKFILLSLALLACNSIGFAQKKIIGNGVVGTEVRQTASYDQVTLIGSLDIELITGKEGDLVISGETNLFIYIETQVINNELIIKFKDKNSYTTKKPLKVIVPIKDISKINVKGSGDIVGKNKFNLKNINVVVNGSGDLTLDLESDSISAEVFGSGDIRLKGNTKQFKAFVKGSGDIKAKNLQSQVSELTVNGSGDIESKTTNQVNASVFGSGDIRVIGKPAKITKQIKGSGDIKIN